MVLLAVLCFTVAGWLTWFSYDITAGLPKRDAIRGQAQGFLVLLTQGIGMYGGAKINDLFFTSKVGEPSKAGAQVLSVWPDFWWVPAAMAGGILVLFFLLFRDRVKPSVDEVIEEAASTPETIQ